MRCLHFRQQLGGWLLEQKPNKGAERVLRTLPQQHLCQPRLGNGFPRQYSQGARCEQKWITRISCAIGSIEICSLQLNSIYLPPVSNQTTGAAS
mmetsp:Transcript_48036/g.75011  ORF Transcript_48036/g.75011 Transcript_48036/m.75011 type:complete len:94 (-) Transcript_48036:1020-1301(-)